MSAATVSPPTADVGRRFAALDQKLEAEDYNYEHYRPGHFLDEMRRMLTAAGVPPGEPAPDFVLPRADGGSVRVADLRGRPVLLQFVSFT